VITDVGKKNSKSAGGSNGKDKDKGENSETKSAQEKFAEAQRDLKISWLSKLVF